MAQAGMESPGDTHPMHSLASAHSMHVNAGADGFVRTGAGLYASDGATDGLPGIAGQKLRAARTKTAEELARIAAEAIAEAEAAAAEAEEAMREAERAEGEAAAAEAAAEAAAAAARDAAEAAAAAAAAHPTMPALRPVRKRSRSGRVEA